MSKLCYGCMKMKNNSPVCEHCGYNENVPNYPHQLPIGTVLKDQYIVGKVLGQGGFGITYIGWDQFLETPVAIKEFYPNAYVSRECSVTQNVTCIADTVKDTFQHNRSRFLREARVLAKLSNVPGIVRVHNLFSENSTAYIIMEYVEGIDLKRYLRMRGQTLTVEEMLHVMQPVMKALMQIHKVELVHRDISPDNIMIQPDGTAKLLDFGAAREVVDADQGKEMPQSTEAILKHGFAPIEQYRRRGSLGPWTDVYSLCATIYYCLAGKVPADAPERVMGDDNVNWAQIPGLTDQQRAALEQGMAMLPEKRIASVQELYQALYSRPATEYSTSRSQVRSEAQPKPKPEPKPEPTPAPAPMPEPEPVVKDYPVGTLALEKEDKTKLETVETFKNTQERKTNLPIHNISLDNVKKIASAFKFLTTIVAYFMVLRWAASLLLIKGLLFFSNHYFLIGRYKISFDSSILYRPLARFIDAKICESYTCILPNGFAILGCETLLHSFLLLLLGIATILLPLIFILKKGKIAKLTEAVLIYYLAVIWGAVPLLIRGLLFYSNHYFRIGSYNISINSKIFYQPLIESVHGRITGSNSCLLANGLHLQGCETVFMSTVFLLLGITIFLIPLVLIYRKWYYKIKIN